MTRTTEDSQAIDKPLGRRNLLEQHAQSVLLALITAALLYSGSFVLQAREDAVRTAAQLATLTSEVAALRAQLAAMQAAYGGFVGREDFRDHEDRLRSLEVRPRR